jgi:hypothetical protein
MLDVETLLTIALSFPPWYGDRGETEEQRRELYRPTMAAIVEASNGKETHAALLLAQAIEETRLARYVLENRCADGPVGARCDNGRSRGAFQVGRWCVANDSTGEARCALRAAWYGASRCKERSLTPWHGAFAGLGARDCSWPSADHRVATMKRILRGLRVAH